jgi:hypothetical protein
MATTRGTAIDGPKMLPIGCGPYGAWGSARPKPGLIGGANADLRGIA